MPNIVIQSIDALADLYEFEGRPVTDSRKVAERFGKRHTEVLRSIRSLLKSALRNLHRAILRRAPIPTATSASARCTA